MGQSSSRVSQVVAKQQARSAAREQLQKEFLQAKSKDAPLEMPSELVKFLQDVGPLKSPHEKKSLDDHRKRERMPLAENIQGFDTIRTTNFSTKQEEKDPNDTGVDDLQLYALLRSNKQSTEQEKLIQNSIQIPIILKDTDDTYVGAWPHNVEKLKQQKLREVSPSAVKLVLQDLYESK